MRLPYTPNPPLVTTAEEQAILDRVLARRGPGGLIALDRTLLHAPLIADGFNAFFKAIRTQNSLPPDVREIAFCRVAALTGAWYEWEIHAPIAMQAGLKGDVVVGLRRLGSDVEGLDERQAAVVAYADAMTRQVRVSDEVFGNVKSFFSDKEMVELTASIAGFNLVSRFVVALDIGEMNKDV